MGWGEPGWGVVGGEWMASPWEAKGSSGGTRTVENAAEAVAAAGKITPRGVPPGVVLIAPGADPADKGRPWPPNAWASRM